MEILPLADAQVHEKICVFPVLKGTKQNIYNNLIKSYVIEAIADKKESRPTDALQIDAEIFLQSLAKSNYHLWLFS